LRLNSTYSNPEAYRLGAVSLLLAFGVILAALAFEYWGGHAPCPICLRERYAYYVGVPLLFAALVGLSTGHTETSAALFALVAIAFGANAVLGGYHAGIEWGFWPGPDTCSGALQPLESPADLLKGLKKVRVVRCDSAGWRLFGLSFAGWNAVVSATLCITCWLACRTARQARFI
jgi:disulfide bond formation protein DsbB